VSLVPNRSALKYLCELVLKSGKVKKNSLILDIARCLNLSVFYCLKVVKRTAGFLSLKLASLGVLIIEV